MPFSFTSPSSSRGRFLILCEKYVRSWVWLSSRLFISTIRPDRRLGTSDTNKSIISLFSNILIFESVILLKIRFCAFPISFTLMYFLIISNLFILLSSDLICWNYLLNFNRKCRALVLPVKSIQLGTGCTIAAHSMNSLVTFRTIGRLSYILSVIYHS